MIPELKGKRFGRLVIIERLPKRDSKNIFVLVQCDCGNTKEVRYSTLKARSTTSCGCKKEEVMDIFRLARAKDQTFIDLARPENLNDAFEIFASFKSSIQKSKLNVYLDGPNDDQVVMTDEINGDSLEIDSLGVIYPPVNHPEHDSHRLAKTILKYKKPSR